MIAARVRKGVLGLGLLLIGISVVSAGSGEAWAKVKARQSTSRQSMLEVEQEKEVKYNTCYHPADLNKDFLVGVADKNQLFSKWGMQASGEYSGYDLDGNGEIDGGDLGLLLAAWGTHPGCQADLNEDCSVGSADLGLIMALVDRPFSSESHRADLHKDGTINNVDVGILLAQYGDCPGAGTGAVPPAVLDDTTLSKMREAQ